MAEDLVAPATGDRSPSAAAQPTGSASATGEQSGSSASRVRARLTRFGGTRGPAYPALEPVLQAARANHPKADLGTVERAYVVAERAHRGQLRKSGDPYITHPVAVATILAELGMTPSTLVAALLHDTVEDTEYSLEQLRREFGPEVAMLVDGVTKLDKVTYGDAAQAETVRKMVVAMAHDIRVLVIKLADRLHNARTWKFVPAASAEKKARETLEIYAPLAHRLGMNTIKWELEDLSFATLYPKVYDEIVHLVAERAPAREEYLATVREQVGADLRNAKIKASVTGRPKHYYSIYQKMIVRGRDFTDIYDLVGVRVLVDTVRDCYAALGALHARWNPVPGRFKDYIAMPKFNLYQSLHTTVIGPGGKPVEIQIRTHDMHRRAEYGVAAHWKYKETAKGNGPQDAAGNDMTWLRQLVDWQRETADPAEFLDLLRDEIVHLVAERAPAREEYLAVVRDQVGADLRAAKIKATVTGRPKHYYSIYQKMIVRGRDFADIYDLVGVRVLVDTVRDCYAALGALHARWNPVPGRFKDYIAMPKFNLYQSLHTTVIGPGGKPVEIQIRTHDMHRRAEYGVAAHWKYKENAKSNGGTQTEAPGGGDMAWLRQLVDWQRETADPTEFLDSLRFEIAGSEVYVFTPKGDVIALPQGSTPVDFAYAVHTEVGHRTMGARVNGRLVPLDSTLENGDVVDVFTSKSETAGPSRDWLGFVKSPRARNKIRQWFSKERREEAIEHGKDSIAKAMRKQNLPMQRLLSHESLVALASEMRFADVSALYAAVGEGQVAASTVVQRLVQALGGETGAEEDLAETARPGPTARRVRTGDPGVVVRGVDDVWVKLAKCCTPVPGDDIVGFVTRGAGVSVHRADCINVEQLRQQPERMLDVEWSHTSSSLFLVQIQVEALDRARLLSDVTRVLSDHHVNILSAAVARSRDRVAMSRFVFEMAEPSHLASVLAAVRKIEGVFDVYRITGARPDDALR